MSAGLRRHLMTSLGVVLGYQPQIVATQVLDLFDINILLIMTHVELALK